ncbi:MAG TPA: penicillin-binding transpeptidase domain-containing protein, partial [Cellvibrionaceae bacterium]
LFNRFLQGQYPPGSTLKPVIGLGGLHHDVITTEDTVYDPGFYQLRNDDRLYRDWKRQGHGPKVDLKQAIAESCNVYYYDLGFKLGVDRMHSFGTQFGLGNLTLVDLPSERRGLWPSRDWKRGARGLPWFPGDSLNMAIGQGDVLATPLQLAVATATLANRGTRYRPQVVASINGEPVPPIIENQVVSSEEHWDAVLAAMGEVIHGERGTAQRIARGANYRMGGKTGTAQVVAIAQNAKYDSESLSERNREHALFVGFAPLDAPQIAVAVLVENAESGSGAAAPVARRVFDAWLLREPVEN